MSNTSKKLKTSTVERANNRFDFFVNWERWSNNSIFYRLTTPLNMFKDPNFIPNPGLKIMKESNLSAQPIDLLNPHLYYSDPFFGYYQQRITRWTISKEDLNDFLQGTIFSIPIGSYGPTSFSSFGLIADSPNVGVNEGWRLFYPWGFRPAGYKGGFQTSDDTTFEEEQQGYKTVLGLLKEGGNFTIDGLNKSEFLVDRVKEKLPIILNELENYWDIDDLSSYKWHRIKKKLIETEDGAIEAYFAEESFSGPSPFLYAGGVLKYDPEVFFTPSKFSFTYKIALSLQDKNKGILAHKKSLLTNNENKPKEPRLYEKIVTTLSFNGGKELDCFLEHSSLNDYNSNIYGLCCPQADCYVYNFDLNNRSSGNGNLDLFNSALTISRKNGTFYIPAGIGKEPGMISDGSATQTNHYGLFTTTPCVCSIKLRIYENIQIKSMERDSSLDSSIRNRTQYFKRGKLIQEMEMNPTFVDYIPRIEDLYAYPSSKISTEFSRLLPINKENWQSSTPGIRFIGEGHTEKINIEASCGLVSKQQMSFSVNDLTIGANWFIGNSCINIGDWDIPPVSKNGSGIDPTDYLGFQTTDGVGARNWLDDISRYYSIPYTVSYSTIKETVDQAAQYGVNVILNQTNNLPRTLTLLNRGNVLYCPSCSWYGFKGVMYFTNLFSYNLNSVQISQTLWNEQTKYTWINPYTPVKFLGSDFKESILPVSGTNTIYSDLIIQGANQLTAVTLVSSKLDEYAEYPISLRLTTWNNSNETISGPRIGLDGPIISYDDEYGRQQFYPFFRSTLDIFGKDKLQKREENIKVELYPETDPPQFISPFKEDQFYLLFDESPKTFRSSIFKTTTKHPYMSQQFVGTAWKVSLQSYLGDWSYNTGTLNSISTYQFNLAYKQILNRGIIPPFTASMYVQSTPTIQVSSFRDVWINHEPYDWLKKRITFKFQDSALILPSPFVGIKFYTPNYYFLKEQEIEIFVIKTPEFKMDLELLTIESDSAVNSIQFSKPELTNFANSTDQRAFISGKLKFNKIGIVNLRVKGELMYDQRTLNQQLQITYPEFGEVVSYFDKTMSSNYNSNLNPLVLKDSTWPQIPPNEILTADVINNVIDRLYDNIETINAYTKTYKPKYKFYGWMGPYEKIRFYKPYVSSPIKDWNDLLEDKTTWEMMLRAPLQTKKWKFHEQPVHFAKLNPTCNQKYCISWRWDARKRKADNRSIKTTWKNTKRGAKYAKRWNYEPCVSSSAVLDCNRGSWKFSTIDPSDFPIKCYTKRVCQLKDVKIHPSTGKIIMAYSTEINIIDTDYEATLLTRTGAADDEFPFLNIASIDITKEEKIIVLDKTLAKISLFNVNLDTYELTLFTSWGTYGYTEEATEFNNPNHLFVDQEGFVWVTDTGNRQIKKFDSLGKLKLYITSPLFVDNEPISSCLDSNQNLHVLTKTKVLVFNSVTQQFLFHYKLFDPQDTPISIACSFNKEMIYISSINGVTKYFRNGNICYPLVSNLECQYSAIETKEQKEFYGVHQDKFRNVYICANDKLLKIPDLQHPSMNRAAIDEGLYWKKEQLYIHKEEYVQDWVYLKAFHRLWDNVELLRTSLFYTQEGCKTYVSPKYKKEDLVLGQNEILTNSVINRLTEQIWENILSLAQFFKDRCE